MCVTVRQFLRGFIYIAASSASELPLLTGPVLMHEGGDETGIETCKNRLYLRKKSFFARFFAHRTERKKKRERGRC